MSLFRLVLVFATLLPALVYSQDSTIAKNSLDSIIINKNKLQIFSKDTSAKFVSTLKKVVGSSPYLPTEKPRIALIRSMLLPGWGQITNKDYWKLPLVYGSAGAGWYFGNITNNKKYKLYLGFYEKVFFLSQSAVSLSNGNLLASNTPFFLDVEVKNNKINPKGIYFVNNENVTYEINKLTEGSYLASEINTENLTLRGPYTENTIRSAKNQYRRWRDLSRIGFAVGWLFFAIEANASAHLKAFDVNDNISVSFKPYSGSNFESIAGLGIQINFK